MTSPRAQPATQHRSREFVVLLGMGALAVAALTGYLIWSSYREAILSAETTSRNYAAIIETRLDATLRRADANLQEQTRTLPIAVLSKQAVPLYAEELNAELDLQLVNFPEVSRLRIFDAEGNFLYASDSEAIPSVNISDRDYFRELRDNPQNGTIFTEVLIGRVSGKENLYATRAFRDATGAFRGNINAVIELDYFREIFESMDVGPQGVVAVFRRDTMTQIIRSPAIPGTTNQPMPQSYPMARAIAAGQMKGTFEFPSETDGIVRIFSFSVLDRYPFFVSVGLAREDVLAGWRNRSLAVGTTGMLLVLTIAVLLIRVWRAEALHGQMVIALSRSNEWAQLVLDKSMNAVIGTNSEGLVTEWSAGAVRMFGYTIHEARGKALSTLIVPPALDSFDARGLKRLIETSQDQGTSRRSETTAIRADGSEFPVELSIAHFQHDGDHSFSAIVRDITLRKQNEADRLILHKKGEADRLALENRLREAQKIEAIGKLTGGMAHDFNNYLGVIIGNLDLLKDRVDIDPAATKLADAALSGALRSAELTRSLLAFSRRQSLNPQLTDVNKRVGAIAMLLRRTIGEDIALTSAFAPNLWPVRIDGAQLDSCILNLANNARDAMPRGGALTISTRNTELDAKYVQAHPDVMPGEYVSIEVSDTGAGMSPETLAHAFEPFFSTKPAGHGTGLGLSMVYGFVMQSGGHINISSEVGHGTTVRIYLPRDRVAQQVADAPSEARDAATTGGKETILLVEDNEQMRQTAAAQLGSLGYRVIEAESGAAALAILENSETPIDLLFTDIVMPGNLDGHGLAKRALARQPDIKILLTSGFSGDASRDDDNPTAALKILNKPYRLRDLVQAIRAALDAKPARPDGPEQPIVVSQPGGPQAQAFKQFAAKA